MADSSQLSNDDSPSKRRGFTVYLEEEPRQEFENFLKDLNGRRRKKNLPKYTKTDIASMGLMEIVKRYKGRPEQLSIDFGDSPEIQGD